jgi:hypothetical protein
MTILISLAALLISALTLYRTQFYVRESLRLTITGSEFWFSDEGEYLVFESRLKFSVENKGNRNAILVSAAPVQWLKRTHGGSQQWAWEGMPLHNPPNQPSIPESFLLEDVALGPSTVRMAMTVTSERVYPSRHEQLGVDATAGIWRTVVGIKTVAIDGNGERHEMVAPVRLLDVRRNNVTGRWGRKGEVEPYQKTFDLYRDTNITAEALLNSR